LVCGAALAAGCLIVESLAAPAWSVAVGDTAWATRLVQARWAGVALVAAAAWASRATIARHGQRAALACLAAASLAGGVVVASDAAGRLLATPLRQLAATAPDAQLTFSGLVVGVARGQGDTVTVPVAVWLVDGLRMPGRVQLYLPKDQDQSPAAAMAPLPGDPIAWRGSLYLPEPQLNPYEHDARRGLARDGFAARSRATALGPAQSPGFAGGMASKAMMAPLRVAGWVRHRLARSYAASLGPEARGLATAFVLGDRDLLSEQALTAFESSGSLHLAAVSGLHVGLLASAVATVVRRLRGERLARLGASCAVALFAMLTGFAPPVARASLLVLLAAWPPKGRKPTAASSLGIAAAALLVLSPLVAGEPSFQLSFAATLGIVCCGTKGAGVAAQDVPARRGAVRRWADRLAGPLAAGAAAHLATLPVAIHAFHRFCPWAPLTNLLMLPAGSTAITLSLAASVPALIAPPLMRPLAPVMDVAAGALVRLGNLLGRLPVSLVEPGHPGVAVIVAAACGILWSIWRLSRQDRVSPVHRWRARVAPWLIAGAMAAAMFVAAAVRHRPAGEIEVMFFAVGQGDTALIRAGRAAVLVDLGPPGPPGSVRSSALARRVAPCLRATRVRPLAAVITHPHADHVGGLADAWRAWPELKVYTRADLAQETAGWARLDEQTAASAARDARRVAAVEAPGRLIVATGMRGADGGRGPDLVLELFWTGTYGRDHPNELSVGVRAYLAGREGAAVLLTGDAGFIAEALWLREHGHLLAAPVLKVGHHGSGGSSSEPFLAAVGPSVSVVSVGPNRFGHPSPAALRRLTGHTAGPVLRTDRSGWICVRLRPDGVEARTWRGR
jgi:competence protein ComEC